jgi:DNA-binding CsgD family transcriptional regulator
MATRDRQPQLIDRRSERATLDRLVVGLRRGHSSALVVRGEAGVGKSVLLEYLAGQATGCRLLHAVGVESEMELAFAGLHQLCAPLLSKLDGLPAPQRVALATALGLQGGQAPDRFLVGLAVLSLLGETAEARPVVCLIDDAQWLDSASAQVLGFVGRRVLAESVALVFGSRRPAEQIGLAGLRELVVVGLAYQDARALLASMVPGPIDDRVRDRIISETAGNPLALLELPRGHNFSEFASGLWKPNEAPLTARIEESFTRRIMRLPADSRLLLLLAAAEPTGDPALMWRAAVQLGITSSALEPAAQAGLLTVGRQVHFRHPLVRSAVYRSAADDDRRGAHRALAQVTDAAVEPDRRAWHRAHSVKGTDESAAAELERSAGRAQARGGFAAAAAFLGRAADLSADAGRRTERMLAAAQANFHAGDFDAALGLLAAAQAGPLDALGRARIDLLHAAIAYAQNRGSDAPMLLMQAARTLESLDVRLSRDTYLDAWGAALFAGHLAGAGSLPELSEAVVSAPAPSERKPCDDLLDGLSLSFTAGRAAATPLMRRATAAFAGTEASRDEALRWGWLACVAAGYLWDLDLCLATAARNVELARAAGALEVLEVALNVSAQPVALFGDVERARLLVAEAAAVHEATGTTMAPYGALTLAVCQGDQSGLQVASQTIREATASGQGTAVQYAQWAKAGLLNAAARHEEALAAARASDVTPEMSARGWSLSEMVEAAVKSGDRASAEHALDALTVYTAGVDTDWARGVHTRARALLADDAGAEPLYRKAIEHLAAARMRPELARTYLLYGEWLLDTGRRDEAREQLRAAHDVFVSIGAVGFAERARAALVEAGERVRARSLEVRDDLTAQEEHIALLARDGLTNPEIGTQLFISPRTVEWHLRKVFTKLGISSRKGLADALCDRRWQVRPPRVLTGPPTQG